MNQSKTLVLTDFWVPTKRFPDSNLYSNQIGWTIEQKVDSGGYDSTTDVWNHLISLSSEDVVGFDLGFFFLEEMNMYYLDNIDGIVYKLPLNDDWDGKYLMDKFQFPHFDKLKAEDAFMFDNANEVWNGFKLGDRDMEYILNHSVLFLGT